MHHITVLALLVPLAFSLATTDTGPVTEILAHVIQQLLLWGGGCPCVYMFIVSYFAEIEINGKSFSTTRQPLLSIGFIVITRIYF